jgi:hypothetical protein
VKVKHEHIQEKNCCYSLQKPLSSYLLTKTLALRYSEVNFSWCFVWFLTLISSFTQRKSYEQYLDLWWSWRLSSYCSYETSHNKDVRGLEIGLHTFLNSALHGGEWSFWDSSRFTLEETATSHQHPLDRRLCRSYKCLASNRNSPNRHQLSWPRFFVIFLGPSRQM